MATAILAMGGLMYGAMSADADGLSAPQVIGAFAIAVVAFVAFLIAQARGAHPMVPLDLFRSRTVSVAFIVGYHGLPFVMSLYPQQVRGPSSVATGVAFLRMMPIGAHLTPPVESSTPAVRSEAHSPSPSSAHSSPIRRPSCKARAAVC